MEGCFHKIQNVRYLSLRRQGDALHPFAKQPSPLAAIPAAIRRLLALRNALRWHFTGKRALCYLQRPWAMLPFRIAAPFPRRENH